MTLSDGTLGAGAPGWKKWEGMRGRPQEAAWNEA